MKKRLNGKLILNRETLRTLNEPDLDRAHGGITRFCGTTEGSCVTCGEASCACSHIDTCSCNGYC